MVRRLLLVQLLVLVCGIPESDSNFRTKQDDTPCPVDPNKENGDHRQHTVNELI